MTQLSRTSFLGDVAEHKLTILKDDGVYRHLHLSGGNVEHQFTITTWPRHLCMSGDMGTYVFSRIEDMFCFFRSPISDPVSALRIKPDYWEQKVLAQCNTDGIRRFDVNDVERHLGLALEGFIETRNPLVEKDALAIVRASKAVSDFKINREDDETEVVHYINHWDKEHAGGMSLHDFWEDYKDPFTYRFLWCCFAIVWAISEYDAATANKGAA